MKTAVYAFAVFAVAVVGFVIWASFNLNAVVENIIETTGSALSETAVQVESVDIVPSQGVAKINGLTIANPDGFRINDAFSFKSITARIDPQQFNRRLVIIDELEIDAPVIAYDLRPTGTNIEKLRDTIVGNIGSTGETEGAGGPLFIIRRLHITRGEIIVEAGSEKASSDLPAIILKNIGGEEGVSGSQIGALIIDELTGNVLSAIGKGELFEWLDRRFGDGAGDLLDGIFGD